MVLVMMEVMNITEIPYTLIVKNLTMITEIAMYLEEQRKQDHTQTIKLKSNSSEICPDCKGSGSNGDGLCSSCNGKGLI